MDTSSSVTNERRNPGIIGWVTVIVILSIVAVIFLILWLVALNQHPNVITQNCFGTYGVTGNVDAPVLNTCGTSNLDPCIFSKNTIADCETQCDTLSSICDAFTFDFNTTTMKIVNRNNAFTSVGVNLFVRQPL